MLPVAVRREVTRRAKDCCEYCLSQLDFSPSQFSVNHIVPKARGGDDALDNLALACQSCNNHKHTATSAIDPVSGQLVALFHPRRDRWTQHFAWSDDKTIIIGITASGRATVSRLRLNRVSLVNLRRLLVEAGKHPPR